MNCSVSLQLRSDDLDRIREALESGKSAAPESEGEKGMFFQHFVAQISF
jgi:hypothetical protein